MYVMRQASNDANSIELLEMTRGALHKTLRNHPGRLKPDSEAWYPRYYPVTARRAHQWVKDGGLHSTALHVSDGRIRRA
jgi:hypothetical protein